MKKHLLGEFNPSYESFPHLDDVFFQFRTSEFVSLSARKRFRKINTVLLDQIEAATIPCFLLPAVLEFIDKVNHEKLLHEIFRFSSFEFWLNHFSGLTLEQNMRVRAKIVGQSIPRDEYQIFFPVGMGKTFPGSHFVAAHLSPDIDTTIASFWGWIDAFGARISEGIHQWSLPGTFADSHVTLLFQKLFSKSVFELLSRQATTLTLTAQDLVTEKDLVKVKVDTLLGNLDHSLAGKPIILIDEHGHFKGDWRSSDAEAVRHIVVLFNSCIRWFENTVHATLISVFAKKSIHLHDITHALETIFSITLKECDPAKELTDKQKKYQNDYLKKILGVSKGLNSSFTEITANLDKTTNSQFSEFKLNLESLTDPSLFDAESRLIEDRPRIFSRLEKIIKSLDQAIQHMRNWIDRLEIMLEVKEKVLGIPPQFITLKSDVEEIRSKIENLEYIAVVIPEHDGHWFPVGIVHAHELRKPILGTVTLRDFCNFQETKMASYLEVISVVDHHKSDIKTTSIPTIVVGDAQSSNTIIAEATCKICEQYSTLDIPAAELTKELTLLSGSIKNKQEIKKLKRLLQLKLNTENPKEYFIHPLREYIEYLCFIIAILDDTDLLTKVTNRDVECVARLLNRMKSISMQRDTEIINLDDLPKDSSFAKQAAKRILQNNDMYSIYKKIYEFKEQEVEHNLTACVSGKPNAIFADTKEQNGCCRVGQTKIFSTNYPLFATHASELRKIWLTDAKRSYEADNQIIDLHIHMISTIAGAEEVHKGNAGGYNHQDEIWLWAAPTPQGREHLINFLNGFQTTSAVQQSVFEVEFTGPNAQELEQVFSQNFAKSVRKIAKDANKGLPIAVLRFKAGLVNSRKAMITPFLPRYIP